MIAGALACAATLIVFAAVRPLAARLGNPPWASPVLIAALAIAAGLALLGIPVARFVAATLPLRWLLGPALVALALVIDGNRALVRTRLRPVLLAVIAGATTGVASAWGLARLFGLDHALLTAATTKTISTPFALAVMASVGGPMALAAAFAVLTGVIGALLVPGMFDRLRITDPAARGLGLGVAAHIVGTEWLTRRDPRAGGMAALGMVTAGVLVALVLPLLWPLLMR